MSGKSVNYEATATKKKVSLILKQLETACSVQQLNNIYFLIPSDKNNPQ